MPRKTNASPKKVTKKKAASKKAAPVTHSKKEGGGLGVVIVLLVGILIIGAMFIAIQNNKTTELEKEVTMLTGELEGKFAELNDELASTKEEQEKQKMEAELKARFPNTYSSTNNGFSFRYPGNMIIANVETDIDEIYKERVRLELENDPKRDIEGGDGGPDSFEIQVYSNLEDIDLLEWLESNANEPYYTNFGSPEGSELDENERQVYEVKTINENEYVLYVLDNSIIPRDEYALKKENMIIRISVTGELRDDAVEILEYLIF